LPASQVTDLRILLNSQHFFPARVQATERIKTCADLEQRQRRYP
jgi:hypothetical protein